MFLASYAVSGRKFLNQPLNGYVDYIEAAMPVIAFMGVSYVQRFGGHIRMDMIIGKMRGRVLWALELLTVALILVVILALIWGPGRILTAVLILPNLFGAETVRSISAFQCGRPNFWSPSLSHFWRCGSCCR